MMSTKSSLETPARSWALMQHSRGSARVASEELAPLGRIFRPFVMLSRGRAIISSKPPSRLNLRMLMSLHWLSWPLRHGLQLPQAIPGQTWIVSSSWIVAFSGASRTLPTISWPNTLG